MVGKPGLSKQLACDAEKTLTHQVVSLLEAYLARFQVAPQFDADDGAHYLLPIPGVVHSYVVEAEGALSCQ